VEDEDPKKEQVEDEDLKEADLDEGPEGKPVEEPDIESALPIESEPEPKATGSEGVVVGCVRGHLH